MSVCKPEDLPELLPPRARLIGFDLGTKTIGIALSDTTLAVASPLETIKRTKFSRDVERIEALIAEHGVGGLVVGLPVNMDGTEGPRCQSARAFANNLLKRREMPLVFWDERLSTAAVERMMTDEADLSRRRRGELVDKLAAAWILQGLLDALRARRETSPSPRRGEG